MSGRKTLDHLCLSSRASEFQAAIGTRFRCHKRALAPLSGLWLSWLRARCVATHAHLWRELRFGCCDAGGQFRLDKYPAVVIIDAVASQFAQLMLQSQPGDFVGQGQTVDIIYTPSNSPFFLADIVDFTANGQPDFVHFAVGNPAASPNTFATLDFSTAGLGIPILPGTYGLPGNTAQRASFAEPGHAGLDVTFQNRGSNTLTGNFTITDVTFFLDANNTLEIGSFAASFEQHSEGAVPALFGTFTYQSSVPDSGATALLLIIGVVGLCLCAALFQRRGNRSFQIGTS